MQTVFLKNSGKIRKINDLKFPSDYVWSKNTFPNITGRKVFSGALKTDQLISEGTIDGIDTFRVMTKDTPQNISGRAVFTNLEIADKLKVISIKLVFVSKIEL